MADLIHSAVAVHCRGELTPNGALRVAWSCYLSLLLTPFLFFLGILPLFVNDESLKAPVAVGNSWFIGSAMYMSLAMLAAGCETTRQPTEPPSSSDNVQIPASQPAQSQEQTVGIDNFSFSPATLTIPAGTTVTWINHDDVPHTVTANDKAFSSKALDTDDRFSRRFSVPGTYPYFCMVHTHMTGQIIVK